VTKITLLAFNVQIHYQNRVWYAQFIQHSSNAVMLYKQRWNYAITDFCCGPS